MEISISGRNKNIWDKTKRLWSISGRNNFYYIDIRDERTQNVSVRFWNILDETKTFCVNIETHGNKMKDFCFDKEMLEKTKRFFRYKKNISDERKFSFDFDPKPWYRNFSTFVSMSLTLPVGLEPLTEINVHYNSKIMLNAGIN